MFRTGLLALSLVVFSCSGDEKKKTEEADDASYNRFSSRFKTVTPPYQLSDSGFLKNSDTAALRSESFSTLIPDSLKTKWLGRDSAVKWIPLAHFRTQKQADLYLIKAVNGNKRAALLVAAEGESFTDVYPFLVPDEDPNSSQLSVIDKSLGITKTIWLRKPGQPAMEGREVSEYDAAARKFSLILTNPIADGKGEVINPIDTFSRKHKFAGDYGKDGRNFVSIRDGRFPNQLQVFVHLEHNKGACTGELKGDLLLTSGTTAVYRQSGDPCVLEFRFTGSSVTLKEEEGCGAHRGIDCSLNGTYARKKDVKPKTPTGKKQAK